MPQHWEEPTFVGMGGKVGDAAVTAKAAWPSVPAGETTTIGLAAINVRPHGSTQIHTVNALDPGTAHYLQAPTPNSGDVVPAGRGG